MPSHEPLRTPPPSSSPRLPRPIGPLTEALFATLRQDPPVDVRLPQAASLAGDLLADDDFQLALYALYELHYRGFAGVSEAWEWNPGLLAFRETLEDGFEQGLLAVRRADQPIDPAQIDLALRAILAEDDGPPLSRYLQARATREQFLEFVVHRSAYQLKEADPHSWALPRLSGTPKAALVAIQSDEYGDGVAPRAHAELFRASMRALGLDGAYGAYLDLLPGTTLATVNLMSLFGLHRRWRGAIVGHLAAFEMSSSIPNGRYSRGLQRLGCPEATPFYDEHVVADSVHENLAAVDLAGGLARAEPQLAADIVFGARALVALDARFAERLMSCWAAGRTSLRSGLPNVAAVQVAP